MVPVLSCRGLRHLADRGIAQESWRPSGRRGEAQASESACRAAAAPGSCPASPSQLAPPPNSRSHHPLWVGPAWGPPFSSPQGQGSDSVSFSSPQQVPQPEVVPPQKPTPPPRKKSLEKKSSLKRALSLKKTTSEEPKRVGLATILGPETRPKRPSFLPLCVSGPRTSSSSSHGKQALAVAIATQPPPALESF